MKLKPLPVEAVVRGYLIGSGWKDYQRTGSVCGIELPTGLRMASKLPEPIFTPANKAELGTHDENISFEQMQEIIGAELAFRIRSISLALYAAAAEYAATRGIIIADTKFEFGIDARRSTATDGRSSDGRLVALLAGRAIRRRLVAAVVRQAVRARLARDAALGQGAATAAHCRPMSLRKPPRSIAKRCLRLTGQTVRRRPVIA